RKYHLPHRFGAEVLEAAQRAAEQHVPARALTARRDFRALPIVTIDGETARDFDDAVTVRRLEHGGFELQVHIADVAHYVREGDAPLRERYAPLVATFELMQELALILNRKRVRRGSIDFDLPEPVIEFDEQGLMRGVVRSERNIAHRLIEEFMLSANECVA